MLWNFSLLFLFLLRVTLNGYQLRLAGVVCVDLYNLMELARLNLMWLILDLYLSTLARQHRTTRVVDRSTRARFVYLLYNKRRIALVHETEHSDQVTALALDVTKVVRRTLKDHLGFPIAIGNAIVPASRRGSATESYHKKKAEYNSRHLNY